MYNDKITKAGQSFENTTMKPIFNANASIETRRHII